MTRTPRPALFESAGFDYVGGLAQTWAAVEPAQRWVDETPAGPRSPYELVLDFLESEDPYPAGTAVFAARWRPSQWGVGTITSRVDVDEWAVEYLDDSGSVCRDHTELSPALWPAR